MATIRDRYTKDGKRSWQAIIRKKGAPVVSQVFKNKTNAKRWADQVEDEIKGGKFLPRVEAEKHTLNEAIDRYLDGWEVIDSKGRVTKIPAPLLELAPHEQRNRRQRLKWWKDQLGALSLAAVTQLEIANARNRLIAGRGPTGEPVSGSTANRYQAALSAVLKMTVNEWGWLDENSARKVKRKDENSGRVRYLGQRDEEEDHDQGERERLFDACKNADARLYALVLCAEASGARRGELLGLPWSDIDFSNSVPRAVLHKTKNRDRRVIFFHGDSGKLLRRMKKAPHISGYVFAAKSGKPTFPKRAWEKALEQSKVIDFRFHDLRHTFASYAAMSGASLPELMALMGHRSMQMVMRYAHLAEQHQEKVAARMAEKFLGAS